MWLVTSCTFEYAPSRQDELVVCDSFCWASSGGSISPRWGSLLSWRLFFNLWDEVGCEPSSCNCFLDRVVRWVKVGLWCSGLFPGFHVWLFAGALLVNRPRDRDTVEWVSGVITGKGLLVRQLSTSIMLFLIIPNLLLLLVRLSPWSRVVCWVGVVCRSSDPPPVGGVFLICRFCRMRKVALVEKIGSIGNFLLVLFWVTGPKFLPSVLDLSLELPAGKCSTGWLVGWVLVSWELLVAQQSWNALGLILWRFFALYTEKYLVSVLQMRKRGPRESSCGKNKACSTEWVLCLENFFKRE